MPSISPDTTPFYGGGQVKTPVDSFPTSGSPPSGAIHHNLGSVAIDNSAAIAYMLVSKVGNVATWSPCAGSSSILNTLTGNSGGAILPLSGNITLSGSAPLSFSGASHTITGTVAVANDSNMNTGTSSAVVCTPSNFGPYYKFNSWTPVIAASTGAFTIVYAEQTGYYYRIDRFVFIQFRIEVSSFLINTALNNMLVAGLPFNAGVGTPSAFHGNIAVNLGTVDLDAGAVQVHCRPIPSSKQMVFVETYDNSALTLLQVSGLTGTTVVEGSGFYTTDDA